MVLQDSEYYFALLRKEPICEWPGESPQPFTRRQVRLAVNGLKKCFGIPSVCTIDDALDAMLKRDTAFYDAVVKMFEEDSHSETTRRNLRLMLEKVNSHV